MRAADPAGLSLPNRTLPSKTRHLDISEIEPTTPIALDHGLGRLHNLPDDVRKHEVALLVGEEDIMEREDGCGGAENAEDVAK